ncbi:MAG: zf-HC2 domain-containing protein [Pseudorhodoplanes sp.]|nr:MAG: zf-HC2 domain-containing protein [Pseudorhodoplanes sp.]
MNANIKEREEISDIEALLPWFAAGTLSRKEAARVEQALATDAELARRFELVREELGEAIRLNESLGAPSARALKTLFEKIDAEAPAARGASFGLFGRLSEFVAGFSPRTLAYAGAVAALALVLQAGIITGVLMQERGDAGYRTVSVEPGRTADAGTFVLVRFAPQASIADITRLLEDNKAVLVDGPTAGLYRVRVAASGLSKDELARIVKQLQDNKAVGFVAPAH